MKLMRGFSAFALLLGLAGVVRAADKQSWTGTLVDGACYLQDHSLTGNDRMGMKGCGTECLKMGRPAGILTGEKQFFILVAPPLDLAPYVGQTIRVTGEQNTGTIVVSKLEVKKGTTWTAVKLWSVM